MHGASRPGVVANFISPFAVILVAIFVARASLHAAQPDPSGPFCSQPWEVPALPSLPLEDECAHVKESQRGIAGVVPDDPVLEKLSPLPHPFLNGTTVKAWDKQA